MRARNLPIFAVHGWGLNAAVFAPLGDSLSGHALLAVDLPGHGLRREEVLGGDAGGIAERLLADAPPRAVWLGWSLGGLLALLAAAARPDRVAGLILVAAAASFAARPGWSQGMPRERLERMAEQLLEDPEGTVSDFLTLQVLASAGARMSLRQLQAALAERGAAASAALTDGLALLQRLDLRSVAADLDTPALVTGGGRDRLVCPRAVRDLGERLPRAETMLFDTAGHVPFLSHRVAFAAAVDAFLVSAGL